MEFTVYGMKIRNREDRLATDMFLPKASSPPYLVDLLLVESSHPRCFALIVGTRLVVVPLRDTHGRGGRNTYCSSRLSFAHTS
jgi:hypothetical protein